MKYGWSVKCDTRKLLKEIEAYRKKMETGMRSVVRDLSRRIVSFARKAYGNDAVTVTPDPVTQDGTTCATVIRANGRPVVFVEFGAGDLTDTGHEYAAALDSAGVYVRAGEWSRTEGLGAAGKHPNYADDGWWYYDGKVCKGVMPRRVLFNAVQNAMTNAEKNAIKAYGKRMK